eukprot:269380-Chlamydomonas_euryale.AAC.1
MGGHARTQGRANCVRACGQIVRGRAGKLCACMRADNVHAGGQTIVCAKGQERAHGQATERRQAGNRVRAGGQSCLRKWAAAVKEEGAHKLHAMTCMSSMLWPA